jgi:2-oxoglutarate dehydrogenase E1 component
MFGGTGDVKYHIGYETDHVHKDSVVHVSLVANSSHLESVDAVVQGKTRAIQDLKYGRDRQRVLPVILHGDAAFSGQGIVAETLNLSRLKGYTTGGTIHIIINNQIGFTTASHQARSTYFPTDMAKALPVPIFHVNGDDPEALIHAADMALQFRQTFAADCVLDVFCFRRYGHNESDEPSFTHPYMYRLIKNHPGVATLYGRLCAVTGVATETEQNEMRRKYAKTLKQALQRTRSEQFSQVNTSQGEAWEKLDSDYSHEPVPTGIPQQTLTRIARHITTVPENFHAHQTLERILARNWKAFSKSKRVDWAFAEALAFGSLVIEGLQVRLSGEDCARGTFSQRHMTWWDARSNKPRSYTPLRTLQEGQARMDVYDSPLSEYSVLGFEYGYALVDPHALTIWEAQFGDFVNGAQVVIDNYIASALHKWDRCNGLVLLLPHGNEGQGPDHSSGHLARFMQLAACNNMQILNMTTPAQYFHALRRQIKAGYRRPMVIMSPKSLLRHPRALSPVIDLTQEHFHEVLDDNCDPLHVTHLLICSGKVYYDLKAKQDYMETKTTAIIRLEQLYPFPEQSLQTCLARYPQVHQVTWVQEEPKNYGAWASIRDRFITHFPAIDLQYVGRDESASSAAGSSRLHKEQQEQLVEQASAGLNVPKATLVSAKKGDIE